MIFISFGFIFYVYGYKQVGTLQLPILVNPEEKISKPIKAFAFVFVYKRALCLHGCRKL